MISPTVSAAKPKRRQSFTASAGGSGIRNWSSSPLSTSCRYSRGRSKVASWTTFDELPVFPWTVAFKLFQRRATGEDDRIHGELLRAEVGVEEVHHENETHR